MARPQKRKRQSADSVQHPEQLHSKKTRLCGPVCRLPNFAPEFFDNLSKLRLTRRALRELDRRNHHLPSSGPRVSTGNRAISGPPAKEGVLQLARFARTGGPDLTDLRGYCPRTAVPQAMDTPSTTTKSITTKSKRSSAYDDNFEQHLIDHNIYPRRYRFPNDRTSPRPANWDKIQQSLKAPRGSLEPPEAGAIGFRKFEKSNGAESEGKLIRQIVPLLIGDANIENEGHLPFVNLNSLTGDTTVKPVPDFFDGSRPDALEQKVREDLDRVIIPTKKLQVPVAPNFFLEVKGSGGSSQVAERQALLDGTYGAHMMHALHNYLQETPAYDENAYAFSSTYYDGTLRLFAHHLSAPENPAKTPNHHITLLRNYAVENGDEEWLEGTAAFRNLRQLAKEYRDQLISSANSRARRHNEAPGDTQKSHKSRSTERQVKELGHSSVDDSTFAGPQQSGNDTAIPAEEAGPAIRLGGHDDDHSQDKDSSSTEVPTDFQTSFASSDTSDINGASLVGPQHNPKIYHSPPSPLSTQRPKRRTRSKRRES